MAGQDLSTVSEWLSDRRQPGNWFDIASDEDIHPEITGWMRTILHMQQVAFSPEIRRRIDENELPPEFSLWAAQLIQPFDGGRVVRLNQEIRGVPYLRTKRPVEKGEEIKLSDLEGLEVFDLEEDELDSGHFTIFWTGKSWVGSFDFRSGRAKCGDLLEKAKTFVTASRLAVDNGLAEPSVDSLHTASELVAKARLILSNREADKWKSHSPVISGINRMGKLGNIDASFVSLFNRLSQIRGHAKYATGYRPEIATLDEIELVEAMAAELLESVQQKKPQEN